VCGVGGHHFSASAFTSAPSVSGVCCSRAKTSYPRSASRDRTAGSDSASTTAAFSFPMTSLGVPFGAKSPDQPEMESAGSPNSAKVGMSARWPGACRWSPRKRLCSRLATGAAPPSWRNKDRSDPPTGPALRERSVGSLDPAPRSAAASSTLPPGRVGAEIYPSAGRPPRMAAALRASVAGPKPRRRLNISPRRLRPVHGTSFAREVYLPTEVPLTASADCGRSG
jgi:hypothetical protein